jgi:hypothetical protein
MLAPLDDDLVMRGIGNMLRMALHEADAIMQ